jgi:hypothetical protein
MQLAGNFLPGAAQVLLINFQDIGPKIQLAGNYLPGAAQVLLINFQYLGRKFS